MKVLYVEDNPGDVRLLQYELAEKAPTIEIDWVANYTEAAERLATLVPDAPTYDLILSDMNLPDGTGIALLSFLRERGINLPFIVVTGLGDEESAVSALKAGASDYVVKNETYLARLPATLDAAVRRHQTEKARHAQPLRLLYAEPNPHDSETARKHFSVFVPYIHMDVVPSVVSIEAEDSGGPEQPGEQIQEP